MFICVSGYCPVKKDSRNASHGIVGIRPDLVVQIKTYKNVTRMCAFT